MYIKTVHIKNFRNFRNIDVPLKPYTTIIGENDIGKTNFFDAIKLLLNNNSIQFYSKRLALTDINDSAIKEFQEKTYENLKSIKQRIENNEDLKDIYEMIPIVTITLSFSDASDDYQKKLLCDWLTQDDDTIKYEIEYTFKPKDNLEFIKTMCLMLELDKNANIPIEMYEYTIYSTNNHKPINTQKYNNFNISIISADRDNFSEGTNKVSYKLISTLLEKNLSSEDKCKIGKAYNEFFGEIKDLSSYKSIFEKLDENKFSNLNDIVKHLELLPNFPNLNTIFSNINIGYGNEFLFQKGLGKRNLILMLLLFANYNNNERKYNLMCIEEPEAHLCINNLNIILSFIEKSNLDKNKFLQTIISTHNSKTINKLKFNNVVLLKQDKAITFDKDDKLTRYLAKRPNFDILKILFANKIILVEGATEEMLINTLIELDNNLLNDIEVVAIGQKGFKNFLDIWKKINTGSDKKIGVVRDYDNQENAKNEHDIYNDNKNIFVRTTNGYTLEDDLVNTNNNKNILSKLFNIDDPIIYMKNNKTDAMLELCEHLLLPDNDVNKITISIPKHIKEILDGLQEK